MVRTQQARFLIHVADRAQIASDDLKVGVLANVVLGHLEHP